MKDIMLGSDAHLVTLAPERNSKIEKPDSESQEKGVARSPVPSPSTPPVAYFVRRWRDVSGSGSSSRVIGLDMARGLAVLGMFGVHTQLGSADGWNWLDPTTWSTIAWGNSSATFVVLAGIAIAIISGRLQSLDGVKLLEARVKILTRAALIFAIGGILVALKVELVIIIEFYALYFAMSLPFLRFSWRKLALLALGWIAIMPVAFRFLQPWASQNLEESAFVAFLVTGFYPGFVWFGYILVGMALGRMPLERMKSKVSLVIAGAVMTAVAQGIAGLWSLLPSSVATEVEGLVVGVDLVGLFDAGGHSGSPLDLLSSSGIACMVIGVCLIAQRFLRWPLLPVSAIGSMSLTAYSLHALAFLLFPGFGQEQYAWLKLALVVAAFCVTWRLLLPKGPLEWVMSKVSTWASSVKVRTPQ